MLVTHKVVQKAEGVAFPGGVVIGVERREQRDLDEALAEVRGTVLEHFDGHKSAVLLVAAEDNLAESAVSKELHYGIVGVEDP